VLPFQEHTDSKIYIVGKRRAKRDNFKRKKKGKVGWEGSSTVLQQKTGNHRREPFKISTKLSQGGHGGFEKKPFLIFFAVHWCWGLDGKVAGWGPSRKL